MSRVRCGLPLLLLLLGSACSRNTPTNLFERAEYLILEQRYEEAIPVLKQFLLKNPYHSGAHYYLGRCYFAPKDKFWFAIAEGEIQTALALFLRDGKKSTIQRFSAEYFELICHLDIAKIRLRQAMFLTEKLGDFRAAAALLEQATHSVEAAREVSPNSPDVQQIDQLIRDFRRSLEMPMPRPSTPPRALPGTLI